MLLNLCAYHSASKPATSASVSGNHNSPTAACLQASRPYVATLLYQNYAWPFPSDTTFQINHMMKIAKEAGGFRRLTFGVCTTQPAWRGLQVRHLLGKWPVESEEKNAALVGYPHPCGKHPHCQMLCKLPSGTLSGPMLDLRGMTAQHPTTSFTPPNLQAPYVYDVYRGLRANGVAGFFTWSLEDSAKNSPPFGVEATLQQML